MLACVSLCSNYTSAMHRCLLSSEHPYSSVRAMIHQQSQHNRNVNACVKPSCSFELANTYTLPDEAPQNAQSTHYTYTTSC